MEAAVLGRMWICCRVNIVIRAIGAQGRVKTNFPKIKTVVAGAGSGVVNAARKTMAKMLGDTEVTYLTKEEVRE